MAVGWAADRWLGDPTWLPHPVVGFGRLISGGEKLLNRGAHRIFKGALLSLVLIAAVVAATAWLLCLVKAFSAVAGILLSSLLIFYCLAGTTLIREVKALFGALDESLESGRNRLSRIVGRETATLDEQEVKKAALETLAENLNDGVIAPLFWLMLGGVPAMMGYKMVNTLDSMIGYRTPRYLHFGRWAARIDDVAGYLPARLTALLMLLVAARPSLWPFVRQYGRAHLSPNSGYPEAALAAILDCRFGGAHTYFGEVVEKPYIGSHDRLLTKEDMKRAVAVNRKSEVAMMFLVAVVWMLCSMG